ncbi:hypothetical protein ACFYO2_36495 [Streptomyces sp. NPDC006602]|uniref:hypothetical protein n=1 Tax=Streptomyces sp. NPDC006602 TaxID=3364751 RepID=UPI00368887C0
MNAVGIDTDGRAEIVDIRELSPAEIGPPPSTTPPFGGDRALFPAAAGWSPSAVRVRMARASQTVVVAAPRTR